MIKQNNVPLNESWSFGSAVDDFGTGFIIFLLRELGVIPVLKFAKHEENTRMCHFLSPYMNNIAL
jgi:hypothetical protein